MNDQRIAEAIRAGDFQRAKVIKAERDAERMRYRSCGKTLDAFAVAPFVSGSCVASSTGPRTLAERVQAADVIRFVDGACRRPAITNTIAGYGPGRSGSFDGRS